MFSDKVKSILKLIGTITSIVGVISVFVTVIIYLTKLSDSVDLCLSQKVTSEDILTVIKPYFDNQLQRINDLTADVERLEKRLDGVVLSKRLGFFDSPIPVRIADIKEKSYVITADMKNMESRTIDIKGKIK